MAMNPKFKKAIFLAMFACVIIALFDILAANSGIFASPDQYTLGYYTQGWWSLFFKINMILLAIVPITYFLFIRKDKSETISLFLTPVILWFTGLVDILYFLLQGKMIPSTLPWLNSGVYAIVASVMGLETITRLSLLITAALGLVFVYFLNKYLEKIN
jgi:hypothetical protein